MPCWFGTVLRFSSPHNPCVIYSNVLLDDGIQIQFFQSDDRWYSVNKNNGKAAKTSKALTPETAISDQTRCVCVCVCLSSASPGLVPVESVPRPSALLLMGPLPQTAFIERSDTVDEPDLHSDFINTARSLCLVLTSPRPLWYFPLAKKTAFPLFYLLNLFHSTKITIWLQACTQH